MEEQKELTQDEILVKLKAVSMQSCAYATTLENALYQTMTAASLMLQKPDYQGTLVALFEKLEKVKK